MVFCTVLTFNNGNGTIYRITSNVRNIAYEPTDRSTKWILAMHMIDDIYILLINDLIIRKPSSSLFLKLHNL